jgi:ribonuclease G
MSQDILINWAPQETRVAVVEQGAVQEVHLERTLERGLVGNIYLGKVSRVLPGMQSAFIDIGLDRAAFLHVADLMPNIAAKHATPREKSGAESSGKVLDGDPVLPIERQIFEGQALMVQVLKDPIGTKGARLTAQISIAGRLLVFLPQDNHIGVSQKIPSAQREALRQRVMGLAAPADGSRPRVASSCAPTPKMRHRRRAGATTSATCARPGSASARRIAPAARHAAARRPEPDAARAARPGQRADAVHPHRQRACSAACCRPFATEFMPDTVGKLEHYTGERPIVRPLRHRRRDRAALAAAWTSSPAATSSSTRPRR